MDLENRCWLRREEEKIATPAAATFASTSTAAAAAAVGYSGLLGFHSLSLPFILSPHLNPISASAAAAAAALADFDVCRSTTAAASFFVASTLLGTEELRQSADFYFVVCVFCSVLLCVLLAVRCWRCVLLPGSLSLSGQQQQQSICPLSSFLSLSLSLH